MKWIKNTGKDSWPEPGEKVLAWVTMSCGFHEHEDPFTISYFTFGKHLQNGVFILDRNAGGEAFFEEEVKYFLIPEVPTGEEE